MKIAIIGCGAVTEWCHIPALIAEKDCQVTVCSDPNLARARLVAARLPGAVAMPDWTDALELFDAAIVAVPHHLHREIACALLRNGKHILIEKPMAISTADCEQMIEAAKASKASLTVGQMRRFSPGICFARWVIQSGALGKISRVDVREGGIFDWPVESDFQFKREKAGGGVLMDTGVHTLDTLIYLFDNVRPLSYEDDSSGGVEADCSAMLQVSDGVPCSLELSRTRKLRNSIVVHGERGALDIGMYSNSVRVHSGYADMPEFDCTPVAEQLPHPSIWHHMYIYQLRDWIRSIQEGKSARVSGEEGIKVIRVIEALYMMRKPLRHAWESFD